jgi:hypothetical protein
MLTLPAHAFDLALLGPANGAVAVEPPVTLAWSGPFDATSYMVTVATDGGPAMTFTTAGTSLALPVGTQGQCRTITWGVVSTTPNGPLASDPASASFQTLRPGDFDRNGRVTVSDIFSYLEAWFSHDPRADLDGGGLGVSDVFAFIATWFSGCSP